MPSAGLRRAGTRFRARVLGGILALAITAFVAGFVQFALTIETEERPPARHADGIVALTGGSDRVADAIELLARGHADRLLITGVNAATTREDVARRTPGARPWIECCVDLGYRAADTVGNARETADWARAYGLRSLIVVTSNYHMPRALAEMTFEMPGVDLQAYAVVPDHLRHASWTRFAQRGRLLLGEYVKLLAVKTRQALQGAPGAPDDRHLAAGGGG